MKCMNGFDDLIYATFCAVTLVGIGLLNGCSGSMGDEVGRVASPDGKVDAIVVESSGGATTSFWYYVCVVSHGGHCDATNSNFVLYGASRNKEAYGLDLKWSGNNTVIVEYMSVKRVIKRHAIINIDGDEINIILRSGVIDPHAPPGGMFFNRAQASEKGVRDNPVQGKRPLKPPSHRPHKPLP